MVKVQNYSQGADVEAFSQQNKVVDTQPQQG
jgi:hypothetical protein